MPRTHSIFSRHILWALSLCSFLCSFAYATDCSDPSLPNSRKIGIPSYSSWQEHEDISTSKDTNTSPLSIKMKSGGFGTLSSSVDFSFSNTPKTTIANISVRVKQLSGDGRLSLFAKSIDKKGKTLAEGDRMNAMKSEASAWKNLELKLFVPPRTQRILLGLVGVGQGDYLIEKPSLCAFDESADLSKEETSNQLEQVKSLVHENAKNTDITIFNKALDEASLELHSTNSQFGLYSVLSLLVSSLGAGHSSLLLEDHGASTNTPTSRNPTSFLSDSKSPGVSIIQMPSFVGIKFANLKQQVDKLREELQKQDDRTHCGWVVDLRQHGGGNVWPMLELLAPLIGDGRLGYIETKDHEDPIDVKDGHIYFKGEAVFGGKPIHRAKDTQLWFLVSEFTASSAEALAIFGKRSRNSQILGVKTSGFTSSNKVFPLSGGGRLVLTTSRFLDEKHKPYPEGVYPDVFVKDILDQNEFDTTVGKLSDLCR